MASGQFQFEHSGQPFPPAAQRKVDRLIRRALHDVLDYAHSRSVEYAPRRTGNLQRNIGKDNVVRTGNLYGAGLGIRRAAPYGRFVESGTGIYGPHKSPITARRPGNMMRIPARTLYVGMGGVSREAFVYRRIVMGQKPQRFMLRGYLDARERYMPARMRQLQAQIAQVASETRP